MDGCIYRTKDGECDLYAEGGKYKAWCDMGNCDGRKMTNADLIRSMTDEELAEFMCHNVSNGTVNCAFCAVAEFCRMGHNGWIDWLKEESGE